MLRTYLFALIIGVQTFLGINASNAYIQENLHMYESQPIQTIIAPVDSARFVAQENGGLSFNAIDKLESMGITLHPGSNFAADDNADERALNQCASLVYGVFSVMPPKIVNNVKNLTLYFNDHGRRGLGGGSTIILRCQNMTDKELISVLVHELGHIEDTGVLMGTEGIIASEFMDGSNPVLLDDKSLEFYRISFSNELTLKNGAKKEDFVTGYAMTDPYEDFAETFNFYILHGEIFREMKFENLRLEAKYDFMKQYVFDGQEFYYESEGIPSYEGYRIYDSTTLGYNHNKFLANI